MHKPSESANKLLEMIKKAIADGVVTTSEYEQILGVAHEDGVLDPQEKKLLNQFQEMLSNKTIKRVPD